MTSVVAEKEATSVWLVHFFATYFMQQNTFAFFQGNTCGFKFNDVNDVSINFIGLKIYNNN